MKYLIVFTFLFLIDLYFFIGVRSLFNSTYYQGFILKFFYWIISIFIYVVVLYTMISYQKTTANVDNSPIIYTSLIFVIFISKFVGSIPLIIDDSLRVFRFLINLFRSSDNIFDIQRLDFLKKSALIISGSLLSTLLIGMKWGRYNFKKNIIDIYIDKWPKEMDNYKIVHISDLHLGSFEDVSKLEEVVEMINEEKPNLIVFTGDLVNNLYHEALPFVNTLNKLRSKDGIFSVLGNHDYGDYVMSNRLSNEWIDNFRRLKELESKCGFDLLLNDSRVVSVGSQKFNLVGVENWGAGNFNKDGDLNSAMSNVDDNLPTILLSHDPSHWQEWKSKTNYKIDLQLSGHTHGMQFGIEIPGFKWSPVKYRYKQWAGLYKHNTNQIYVNRGLGHLGYAGRVGIMPDISILNIKKPI